MENKIESKWNELIQKACSRANSRQKTGYLSVLYLSNSDTLILEWKDYEIARVVFKDSKPSIRKYSKDYMLTLPVGRVGSFERTYQCGVNALKKYVALRELEYQFKGSAVSD